MQLLAHPRLAWGGPFSVGLSPPDLALLARRALAARSSELAVDAPTVLRPAAGALCAFGRRSLLRSPALDPRAFPLELYPQCAPQNCVPFRVLDKLLPRYLTIVHCWPARPA